MPSSFFFFLYNSGATADDICFLLPSCEKADSFFFFSQTKFIQSSEFFFHTQRKFPDSSALTDCTKNAAKAFHTYWEVYITFFFFLYHSKDKNMAAVALLPLRSPSSLLSSAWAHTCITGTNKQNKNYAISQALQNKLRYIFQVATPKSQSKTSFQHLEWHAVSFTGLNSTSAAHVNTPRQSHG